MFTFTGNIERLKLGVEKCMVVTCQPTDILSPATGFRHFGTMIAQWVMSLAKERRKFDV